MLYLPKSLCIFVFLLTMFCGCTNEETHFEQGKKTAYFLSLIQKNVKSYNKQKIQQELGEPHLILNNGTEWVYVYQNYDITGSLTDAETCLLYFDKNGNLTNIMIKSLEDIQENAKHVETPTALDLSSVAIQIPSPYHNNKFRKE